MKIILTIFITFIFLFSCSDNGSITEQELSADFFSAPLSGEITISAYDSMLYRAFLEEAARTFEALHPALRVNIETFSAMPEVRRADQGNMQLMAIQAENDPASRSDYLSRVNTNIMSGRGADIYAMDILPLHKFTENNVFLNLEHLMEVDPSFNRGDYRENIIDSLYYKDGIWFLPLDYSFNYFAYDTTLFSEDIASNFGSDRQYSMDELLDIAIPLFDGTNKLFNLTDLGRGQSMWSFLLRSHFDSFVDLENSRANFSDGNFASLLNRVRSYGEMGIINRAVTGQQNAEAIMQQGIITATDRNFYKLNGHVNLLFQFTRGMGPIARLATTGSAPSIESDDQIAGIEALSNGIVPFSFNQAFAINSRGDNIAAAWAFLSFLLSREMQLSASMFNIGLGLPLHNEARYEKTELDMMSMLSFTGASSLNAQQRQALENYRAAVEMLSDSINGFVIQDISLNDMIREEVQQFINAARSAEEVARILQNRANLFLSE